MADYHKIPKLKGTNNYKQWEVSIRASLVVNGVFKVIKDEHITPTNPTLSTTPTGEGVKLSDAEKEQDKWDKHTEMEDKALAAIHITCTPTAYGMIEHLLSAKEAWAKLKSLYGTDSYATKKATFFALQDLRSDQFNDLHAYLSKFMEYTNKLQQMGDPLSQDYQAAIFERGLPEHMEGAVYTLTEIQRSRKEPIDFEYVTTSLVNREVSMKTEESKAFAGNFGKQPKKGQGQNQGQNQNSSGTKPKGQGDKKCNFCGSNHHLIRSCYHANPHLAPEDFTPLTKAQLEERRDRPKDKRPSRQQSKQELDVPKQDKSYTARFSNNKCTKSDEIIIDSGDQEHAFWDRSKFTEYTPVKNHTVSGPTGGKPIRVEGIGTILILVVIDSKVSEFELTDVRHVPNIEYNLLSTTQLDLQGYKHAGGDGKKTFYNKQGQEVLQAFLHDRTYWLETMWIQQMRAFRLKSSVPARNDASWTQWHKRYGHVSMEATKAIARATGVDCQAADRLQKYETQELCESCVSGKITRMPSRIPMPRATINGQCWHIDLASASHVTTLGGHTNVMVSTCEASGFTQIDHMSSRAELPQKLEFRIKHWKNQGYSTAFIRSDNELTQSQRCAQIFKEHGIQLTPSAPYNPHQNGIAERNYSARSGQSSLMLGYHKCSGVRPSTMLTI